MANENIITLTPDGYVTLGIVYGACLYSIDCSDLGGLGIYTDGTFDLWSSFVEVFITSTGPSGGYGGVTHLVGNIKKNLGGFSVNNLTFESTADAFDSLSLVVDGSSVLVMADITHWDGPLENSVFVICCAQST